MTRIKVFTLLKAEYVIGQDVRCIDEERKEIEAFNNVFVIIDGNTVSLEQRDTGRVVRRYVNAPIQIEYVYTETQ